MSVLSIARLRVAALAFVALAGATLAAQSSPQPPAAGAMIRDLRWRNIGNAKLIGRISAVDALESSFAHVIVGSASGGVWKSTNAGTTWTTIFDNYGAAAGAAGVGGGGGRVAPGVYRITMTANRTNYSKTITLRPDPMPQGK